MGDNFLSKSFLFEIVDSTTSVIEASFTLVLPPQQYQIREKPRVTVTKTFGNAFIDDYGPDNIEMTIKGISGTAHAFPTFRTTGASSGQNTFNAVNSALSTSTPTEGYRGIEAFYTFRDEIMRYRDRENFDQKELRVYDLADAQAYKCLLLEFSLDRSADSPFHYPFTIQLLVYANLNGKSAFSPRKIDVSKNPTQTLKNLTAASASVKSRFNIFNNIQNIKNSVAKLNAQIALVRSKFNTFLTQTRGVVDSPLNLTKQLIDTSMKVLGFFHDAYVQGKMSYDTWVNAGESIHDQVNEALHLYGFAIQSGAQQSKDESILETSGMDYATDPSAPEPTTQAKTLTFNGVKTYTVKGGDTLPSIALNTLGDETLWPYIASINSDIYSNADLVAGDTIYIPVTLDSAQANPSNFILTEDRLRDPYGADFRIDSDGNIVLQESNDVALVSGVANVLQSINLRVGTLAGSMIKQTAYGLAAQPGLAGTQQAVSYTKMAITATLLQDPRISTVQDVKVKIAGDGLRVEASVTLVGREETLPVSVVLN